MNRKLIVLGDSTSGTKLGQIGNDTVGWAEYLNEYLPGTGYTSYNECIVGWGIRDFFNRKGSRLNITISSLEKDDVVLACYGTLERSPLSRTDFGGFGARGSLFGEDDRYEIVYDEHYKVEYRVHTFGWYLRQLAQKVKAKNAKLYFLSQIPRNTWENGQHKRTYSIDYAKIMENIANETNVGFLDINEILSVFLNTVGQEKAREFYSPRDASHTTPEGAKIYAEIVVKELHKKYPGDFNFILE